MAEQLDLTNPEVKPQVVTSFYQVVYLQLNWLGETVLIRLRGQNDEIKQFTYEGAEAVQMMKTLNTANLTTNSLQKRVLNKLVADGKISGTVSGSPDV